MDACQETSQVAVGLRVTAHVALHSLRCWIALLLGVGFLPSPASGQGNTFTIGNYQVVNTVRVSRLQDEYTIKAAVTNAGAAAPNVVGTVTSSSADTVVTVRTLQFGAVEAGATKTSTGTFTIRQSRLANFDPGVLSWQFVVNAPSFTAAITSPADGLLANTPTIQVTGTTSSPATTVTVNLIAATLSGNDFTAVVPVSEGANTLTAVATDAGGQVATASVNITRDTEKPRVAIDAPVVGATLRDPRVTVTGIFNDTVIGTVNSQQGSVTVNGVPATVVNRTFSAANVPLTPGPNNLVATGTDRAGNVGTASVTVTYSTAVAPRIVVVSGNEQSAVIGSVLPQPLVALVTDENGAPIANKEVIFKVCQNDGLLTGGGRTARSVFLNTGADGKAQVTFQLGTRVGEGNHQVQATTAGVPGAALFCASGRPAPPALLVLNSGNRQSGVPGQPLPRPFVAIVVDSGNNRLGGIPITFTSLEGGGTFGGLSVQTVTTDSDGRALATLTLGSDEGIENNRVEANFPGNTGLPVAFSASALIPGDAAQTSISGVVLDNSDVPVPGATIRILGTALSTRSDAQGQFILKPVPVGTVRMDVDGTTVTRPGSWVNLDYTLTTVSGQDNGIGMPVRLLQINTASGVGVGLNYGGTITLPEFPGFSLKLLPGSVTFPGGTKVGTVTATVVHLDKTPEVPNFGQQPRFIVSINPKRCIFDPPAQMCLPNLDGLPPGQKTEMYSFDDDLDAFVAIGTGTVSADGTQICSDPGVGVIKGGWHCGGNPAQNGGSNGFNVTFSKVADCKGYDDSTTPPWLVVPKSGNNTAKATITPSSAVTEVEFISAATGKATVSPAAPSASPQTVTVSGVAKGETVVQARQRGTAEICAELGVSVKEPKEVKVAFHFISDNAGHATTRATSVADTLIQEMNDIWTPQANIVFVKHSVDSPTVARDLGSVVRFSRHLESPPDNVPASEHDWDDVVAKADGTADFNIYFVWEYEQDNTPNTDNTDAGTLGGNCVFEDGAGTQIGETLAHEAGHFFGITPADYTDKADELMHAYTDSRGCIVRKAQSDQANP